MDQPNTPMAQESTTSVVQTPNKPKKSNCIMLIIILLICLLIIAMVAVAGLLVYIATRPNTDMTTNSTQPETGSTSDSIG